jgi:DnaK suppressor protein
VNVRDRDEIRRRLEDRRADGGARVDALAEPPEHGAGQGFGKRIGDGTTEAIRRLTDIGVGSSFEERLGRVERAMEKLDDGTYGTCDGCGTAIPEPRLQAMPDSVLCVTCAGARRRVPRPRR